MPKEGPWDQFVKKKRHDGWMGCQSRALLTKFSDIELLIEEKVFFILFWTQQLLFEKKKKGNFFVLQCESLLFDLWAP